MEWSRKCDAPRARRHFPPRSNWCARVCWSSDKNTTSRRSICAPSRRRRPKTSEHEFDIQNAVGSIMGAVTQLFDAPAQRRFQPDDVRVAEALVFAAPEPVDDAVLAARLPHGCDVAAVMSELQRLYAGRGVNLVRAAGRWMFRTAPDLAWLLARETQEKRKISRAAIETLAIVA